MIRERALKAVLVLVGLLFSAAIYPAVGGLRDPAQSDTGDTMMMGIYFALGIFLLLSVRNPSSHRSLIAFAAWSSFAHAVVQGQRKDSPDWMVSVLRFYFAARHKLVWQGLIGRTRSGQKTAISAIRKC